MSEQSIWRNRRALVTGASGFIGTWMVRELQGRGARVTCVMRSRVSAERMAHEGVGDILLLRDLRELESLAADVRSLRPHVLVNLAGYGVLPSQSDAEEAEYINAVLPGLLVRTLRPLQDGWSGLRVLHVGSAQEYGAAGGIFSEGSDCQPTTLYGRTKLAGTRSLLTAAASLGLSARVARAFTVYGPGEVAGRLLPTLLAAARGAAEIPLSAGLQRRDFGYVEDVARLLVDLIEVPADAPEVVNVATGALHTVREFVEQASSVLEIAPERLAFGALPARTDEMEHDGVSVARLRERVGRVLPDDIRGGVARTVARLREFPR